MPLLPHEVAVVAALLPKLLLQHHGSGEENRVGVRHPGDDFPGAGSLSAAVEGDTRGSEGDEGPAPGYGGITAVEASEEAGHGGGGAAGGAGVLQVPVTQHLAGDTMSD